MEGLYFRFHLDIKDSRHRRKWPAKREHKKAGSQQRGWTTKRVDNKEGGLQRRWTTKRVENKKGGLQRGGKQQ